MYEYIDKNAAVGILEAMSRSADCECIKKRLEKAAKRVSALPAADVAPVVHGQWIIGVDDDDFDVKCSKCEWTDIFEVAGIAAVERIAKTMHYCPHCGAKMDGGDSDAVD